MTNKKLEIPDVIFDRFEKGTRVREGIDRRTILHEQFYIHSGQLIKYIYKYRQSVKRTIKINREIKTQIDFY